MNISVLTPSTAPESVISVATGILRDHQARVLVAKRPAHSHQGGKWEFPGGKIQSHETALEGLKRELHEELSITVQAARPFMQVSHAYTDKKVLLDVWEVTQFQGEVRGREGQVVQWVPVAELTSLEFPEADLSILDAIRFPPLYLITDAKRFGQEEFLGKLEQGLQAGARLIQLREHQLSPEDYRAYARQVTDLCHRYSARVLLNVDPESVPRCGADGVHLNAQRLLTLSRRPLDRNLWVAASCHNIQELEQAARIDADFVVVAPVQATASHSHAQPLGWDEFERLCRQTALPVYALGGMRPGDLMRARTCGARGLAMISGIWQAGSISQAVASLISP
ncbi:MAG TPA: Nudix family hydrolase [Acidiferrobacterales bacterium]|nr:Nudix family hydrolase [Acidiferrobacterales bacterium]